MMFLIDSRNTPNDRVWYVTINVTAGNTYDLSAYVNAVDDQNLPIVSWYEGTTALGTAVNTTADNGWTQTLTATYTATTTGAVVFSIRNSRSNNNNDSNDFAIDDITIYEHTPITYQWTGPSGFSSTSPKSGYS